MRVLALTRYSALAASTRQRFIQFFPALADEGVAVTLAPLLGDKYVGSIGRGGKSPALVGAYLRRLSDIVLRARRYDALWVQYEAFPFLPGPLERALSLARRPYIVDYDDAIFHNYDLAGGRIRRFLLGRKLAPLLVGARTCIAGNRYLADYVRHYCPDTVIVPTVVDSTRYVPSLGRDSGPLRVGWIGSPSTWQYVELLLPSIVSVLRRFGAKLQIVGVRPVAAPTEVQFLPWSQETEIAAVQTFDIGIMPLPDDPWARGKCGYKLIQYMSCGIPCVASPVGVNAEIVTPGENGLFATTAEEWAAALTTLLGDAELRQRLGRAGRAAAVARYSLASQAGVVTGVFSALRSRR